MSEMPRLLPHEAAEGFQVAAELLRHTLGADRKHVAVTAVMRERLNRLEHEVERVIILLERGEGKRSLKEEMVFALEQLARQEAWQARQETATLEGIRGKWAVLAVLVTALSGLILGVINVWRH
jgi:hypothetical protein